MRSTFYALDKNLQSLGCVSAGSLASAIRQAQRLWGDAVFDVSHHTPPLLAAKITVDGRLQGG